MFTHLNRGPHNYFTKFVTCVEPSTWTKHCDPTERRKTPHYKPEYYGSIMIDSNVLLSVA